MNTVYIFISPECGCMWGGCDERAFNHHHGTFIAEAGLRVVTSLNGMAAEMATRGRCAACRLNTKRIEAATRFAQAMSPGEKP